MEAKYPGYVCAFCGSSIAQSGLDPCTFHLVTNVSGPRSEQREQTLFCHLLCMKSLAIHAPFYIADPDFSTIGDIEAAQQP